MAGRPRGWSGAVFLVSVLFGSGVAQAQPTLTGGAEFSDLGNDTSFGGAPNLKLVSSGGGVRMSERTFLHVGFDAEAGYDTNVFYQDSDVTGSPLLRLTPQIAFTNANRDGEAPDGLFFDAGVFLQYREYFSDEGEVKKQRAFNPSAYANVVFSGNQAFSVTIGDSFTRSEDPPYGPKMSPITRDHNIVSVDANVAPGSGRIRGVVRYTNLLDHYEGRDLRYASLMGHELMLDVSWAWLPRTAVFTQVAQGMITYFNKDPMKPKYDSYPFRATAGVRGLVTDKIAAQVGIGYATGFYQGPATNPTGLSNLAVAIEGTYRPTVFSTLIAGYRHEFRNSVIGDYYDVDSPYIAAGHIFASRLMTAVFTKYEYRRYAGVRDEVSGVPVARTDHTVQMGVQADYFIQNFFFAGVGYQLRVNGSNTDAATSSMVGLDYLKQQILLRVGVVY